MKKALKIVAAILMLLVTAILAAPYIYGRLWESRTRKDSIRILGSTNVREELSGNCSLFLTFPDASWIAIRYRDLHLMGAPSVAIARDSEGQWFECDRHFCAMFQGYRHVYEINRQLRAEGEPEDPRVSGFKDIHAVAQAETLATARERLTQMGFKALMRP